MEEQTERDKYIAKLEEKLKNAGRARRFLEHEDGAVITEWLTSQINSLLKQVAGKAFVSRPLTDKDGNTTGYMDAQTLKSEYDYAVGQLNAYQKLLTMLNSEASTDTVTINQKIKEAKTDQ